MGSIDRLNNMGQADIDRAKAVLNNYLQFMQRILSTLA